MNCPKCKTEIPDKVILNEAATINGRKTKGRKRSDLKKGGSTYNKIYLRDKKGESDGES